MHLRFSVLGPVQVRRDGRPVPLGSPKQRALLTALLLEANHAVSLDRLVAAVWDADPPRSAVANLRTYVNRLRDTLGAPERLLARAPGYLLAVGPGELDLTEFGEAVRRGREALSSGDPGAALRHLSAALSCWRGAPAEDVPRTAALLPRLDALDEQRALALEAQAEARLALGEYAEAIADLRETLATHATRERLWGYLMLALYRTGDAAAALAAYAHARAILREELGVEPGPDLTALHQAILQRDPALGGPVRSAAPVTPGSPAGPPVWVAPAPLPPPARALPAAPARFTGRDRELKQLIAAITATSPTGRPPVRTVAVHGPAGTGKSALAIHTAHLAAYSFPDGTLYADLRSCTSPYETLNRLLADFLLPGEAPPADEHEAVQRFAAVTRGRRFLVLLDNVTDERQVRPLLAASGECQVVITSRRVLAALDHVEHVPLGPLERGAAHELLARLCGRERVSAEATATDRVAELCDYLPLALHIAGTRLCVRREWSLATFADMLSDERHRLDLLTFGDLSMRDAFRWDYEALLENRGSSDGNVVRLFHRLGTEGVVDCDPALAARLLGCDLHTASAALGRLADIRLVEPVAADLYRINGLTRLYAREMAEAHPEACAPEKRRRRPEKSGKPAERTAGPRK